MDALERLTNQMAEQAESGYEVDSYEVEDHFVRRGMPRNQAKAVAGSLRAAVIKSGKKPVATYAQKGTPNAAAQFDIVIKRNTATLVGIDLPVVVFGVNDLENAYSKEITLPTGVTLLVTCGATTGVAGQPNACRFTYTDGVNTDTVDVTCNQYPYPSFLKATLVDLFRLSKIRYSISDSTQTDQFNRQFDVVERSMFGMKNSNSISLSSYKSPDQFQTSILDIPIVIEVDSITSILHSIKAVAGFSVTLSTFVEKVEKLRM